MAKATVRSYSKNYKPRPIVMAMTRAIAGTMAEVMA